MKKVSIQSYLTAVCLVLFCAGRLSADERLADWYARMRIIIDDGNLTELEKEYRSDMATLWKNATAFIPSALPLYHYAASYTPNKEILVFLDKKGFSSTDIEGWNVFELAALRNENLEVLAYLSSKGMKISSNKWEAICVSAVDMTWKENPDFSRFEFLFSHGLAPNITWFGNTPMGQNLIGMLFYWIVPKSAEAQWKILESFIRYFLQKGTSASTVIYTSIPFQQGKSALSIALESNQGAVAAGLLLDKGGFSLPLKEMDMKALYLAMVNHPALALRLNSMGFVPGTAIAGTDVTLYWALQEYNADMAYRLIQAGSWASTKGPNGQTMLHLLSNLTTEVDYRKTINDLLAKGLVINARDKYGYTPLHYAAKMKNVKKIDALILALLYNKADAALPTSDGIYTLQLWLEGGLYQTKQSKDMLYELLRRTDLRKISWGNSENIIHRIAAKYKEDSNSLWAADLIFSYCDEGLYLAEWINQKNKDGLTPLALFKKRGLKESNVTGFTELLLSYGAQ